MKPTFLKENITEILAIVALFGGITFVFTICFKPIPQQNQQMVNILSGSLFSLVGMAFGYYFGQSKDRKIVPEAGQTITENKEIKTEVV